MIPALGLGLGQRGPHRIDACADLSSLIFGQRAKRPLHHGQCASAPDVGVACRFELVEGAGGRVCLECLCLERVEVDVGHARRPTSMPASSSPPRGSVKCMFAPSPGSLVAQIRPPWASTIPFVMYSPRPVPVRRSPARRKNFAKI